MNKVNTDWITLCFYKDKELKRLTIIFDTQKEAQAFYDKVVNYFPNVREGDDSDTWFVFSKDFGTIQTILNIFYPENAIGIRVEAYDRYSLVYENGLDYLGMLKGDGVARGRRGIDRLKKGRY